MTKKELETFFKKANKVINSYEDKLGVLEYDFFIVSSIVFTSDTDYYYLFSVYQDNKVVEKIAVNDSTDYDRTFKDLSIKYKTNVIYNYNDLTSKQLKYLDDIEDSKLNTEEISDILFKRQFDLFK